VRLASLPPLSSLCSSLPHHLVHGSPPPGFSLLLRSSYDVFQIPAAFKKPDTLSTYYSVRKWHVGAPRMERGCCYLHLGTSHFDSLQARAWKWSRDHIFIHALQPPDARFGHFPAWLNSPLILLQFLYWQPVVRHA
jgi:hypothetical protein